MIPKVETERLRLTALSEDHLKAFTRIQYDPRVARWSGGLPDQPHDADRQQEETWRLMALFLGHWTIRGYGQWAVEDRTTGQFLGRAELCSPHSWPGVEVGWLGQPEIISITVPENTNSRRVMTKIGLLDTGRTVRIRDEEDVLYRMTRTQWHESPLE